MRNSAGPNASLCEKGGGARWAPPPNNPPKSPPSTLPTTRPRNDSRPSAPMQAVSRAPCRGPGRAGQLAWTLLIPEQHETHQSKKSGE